MRPSLSGWVEAAAAPLGGGRWRSASMRPSLSGWVEEEEMIDPDHREAMELQ